MAIQPDALLAHVFEPKPHDYVERDAILYALGVGLGADPCDAVDLGFLDETRLSVLPTFAVTLSSPGMWINNPAFGIDFGKLVHLAQDATFFTPLPPSASVVGEAQVVSLRDRGEGRGALLTLERNIRDRASGAPYCRLHQTLLLRGDGGFDGPAAPADASGIPDAEPDARCSFQTSRRAALIYRLSGDWNPLHLRPEFAQKAGFERPILQGLASYGIAGAAVSRALEQDAVAVTRLACRFSGVVMPGDKLDFHIWRLGGRTAAFRAFVDTRKVLDFGHISWEPLV